jgi:hypothetical protein
VLSKISNDRRNVDARRKAQIHEAYSSRCQGRRNYRTAFHSLRHSLLARAGASLKVLLNQLGHSTASTLAADVHQCGGRRRAGQPDTLGPCWQSGLNPKVGADAEEGRETKKACRYRLLLVGRPGFEPGTSCLSNLICSAQVRYYMTFQPISLGTTSGLVGQPGDNSGRSRASATISHYVDHTQDLGPISGPTQSIPVRRGPLPRPRLQSGHDCGSPYPQERLDANPLRCLSRHGEAANDGHLKIVTSVPYRHPDILGRRVRRQLLRYEAVRR